MYKFLIKNGAPKNTYDKIFKIIDNHSTFFRINTENEYQSPEGYVLEFKEIPTEAIYKIGEMRYVEEI